MIQKPKFPKPGVKENMFWLQVDAIVNRYFKGRKRVGGFRIKVKALILLVLIGVLYFSIVNYGPTMGWGVLFLFFAMGTVLTSYSMNVMHEGSHRTFSSKQWVNSLAACSNIFIVGGNPRNWNVEHNLLHHPYTNIVSVDDDIGSGKAVLRFTKFLPVRFLHRLQKYPWYIFIVYSLLTLNWLIMTDITQTRKYLAYQKAKVIRGYYTRARIARSLVVLYKLVTLSIWIGIPLWAGISVEIVLASFLLMHLTMGTILAHIFQPAHINGYAQEFEQASTLSAKMHQFKTSIDYGVRNWLLTEFSGGLNYQKAHHLFFNITHEHYHIITRIIKNQYAIFYKDTPYLEYDSFSDAVIGNYSYLKKHSTSAKVLLNIN